LRCELFGNEVEDLISNNGAWSTITDCIVRDNNCSGGLLMDADIVNSLVYDNEASTLIRDVDMICCTIVDNDGNIWCEGNGSYNNVFRNNDADLTHDWNSLLTFSISNNPIIDNVGNIQDNVEFVDYGNNDFHLSQCSPGINAGIDSGLPFLDLDGEDRSFDIAVDLGCYEVQLDFPDKIFVDQSATGSNNGSSWANAYTELRNALNNACAYTEVWVAAGTYKPTGGSDRTEYFVIPTGMKIYGGFAGGETFLWQQDYFANVTILSGEIGNQGTTSDNSYHVVVSSSTSDNTLIDGFVIRDGFADQGGNTYGGGIYGAFSDIRVVHCYIQNNECSGSGGGCAFVGSGTPYIEGCFFDANHAGTKGGAIYGGGLVGSSPDIWIEKCRFYDNTAALDGGALFSNNDHTTVESCLFRDNDAIATDPLPGDAMGNSEDNITLVVNSTIVRNHEIGVSNYGTLQFYNSIIWDHDWGSYTNWAPGTTDMQYCIAEFGPTDNNNLNSAPMFIAPFLNNFHLGITSPAINSGNNAFVLNSDDIDYEPRIDQAIVDRGFKETQNGCSNPIDVCESAQDLGNQQYLDGSVYSGTVECATNAGEPVASCGTFAGRSVWYEFGAGIEGGVTIDLHNVVPLGGVFNPKITLFEGTCDNLTEIHCVNMNGDNLGEYLELSGLQNGEDYYFRVEGAFSQEGTYDMTVDPTIGQFTAVDYQFASCQQDGKIDLAVTVDYVHPPTSGWINLNGTNYTITGSPQVIQINNMEADGSTIDLDMHFTSGGADEEYHVTDWLTIPCCVPSNDLMANPATIEVDEAANLYHNRCAEAAGDLNSSCYTNGNRSVWFEFEAQAGPAHEIYLNYTETLTGNFFDPRITVYDFFSHEEIACSNSSGSNQDEVLYTSQLQNGGFYLVKVDGNGFTEGRFLFSIDQVALQGCAEDFNQSGSVDTADLLQMLAAFGCTSNCGVEDLNNNGLVDTSDLLQFLAVFGQDC
jgi:predicted outer membrane repeat protein